MTFKIGPNGEILPESNTGDTPVVLNFGDLNQIMQSGKKPGVVPAAGQDVALMAEVPGSVRFDSGQLDTIMNGPLPNKTLRITGLPPGAEVNYWVDKNGFFLWFDKAGVPFAPHYIKGDLKAVEWNQRHDDMNATRTKTRDAYMCKHGQPLSSFYESLGQNNDSFGYAWRMSQLAQDTLAKEEAFLSKAAQDNKNPYLNLFLCDVLIAQSMQPIIEQFKNQQPIDLKNPQTTAKLQAALEQAQMAIRLSNNGMSHRPYYPPGNVIMPMYPYYNSGDPHAFQYYWGGSLCQAQQRELCIRWFQSLIQTGALTDMMNKFELP